MTSDRPLWKRAPMATGGAVLAALLAAMQGGVPGAPGSVDGARVFQIFVLVLCLVLFRKQAVPPGWAWVWGGFLGVGVLSSLLGAYPALSLKEVFLWVALLLAVPRLAALRGGALLGLGVFLLVAQSIWTVDFLTFWAQMHLLGDVYRPEVFRPFDAFPLFGHPRFLNQFQSWMLPVAALLCLRLKAGPAMRALCWSLLVVSWSQLWLSMGRGSLIALAAGTLAVAVLFGRQGRAFAGLQAGLAVAGFLLYTVLFQLLGRAGGMETVLERPLTTTGRTPAWERAWEMFVQSPFLGRAPQSFAWEGIRFGHPHSAPLQVLAEWGAGGFLLIGICIGAGAVGVFQHHRKGTFRVARRGWLIALVCSSVAGMTHSLVSGILVMPLSQLGGMVVLALWFRVVGLASSSASRVASGLVAVSLLLLVVLGLVFPDVVLPGLGPTSLDLDSLSVQGFVRPRFWADGL